MVESEIEQSSLSPEQRCRAVTLWMWCTKALVLRSHDRQAVFAEKVNQGYLDAPSGQLTLVADFHNGTSEGHLFIIKGVNLSASLLQRRARLMHFGLFVCLSICLSGRVTQEL